jgi:uncharacterized protein (DUF433 family)
MEENKGLAPGEDQPQYVERIHAKPLPDILDEMDANIRAAAEASRQAEEAAKAAREAAKAATKASDLAESRAEEARKAGEEAVEEAMQAVAEAAAKAEDTAKAAREAAEAAAHKAEEADRQAREAVEAFKAVADEASKSAEEARDSVKQARDIFSQEVDEAIRRVREAAQNAIKDILESINESLESKRPHRDASKTAKQNHDRFIEKINKPGYRTEAVIRGKGIPVWAIVAYVLDLNLPYQQIIDDWGGEITADEINSAMEYYRQNPEEIEQKRRWTPSR